MRQKSTVLMESIIEYINEYYLENEATPSTTDIAAAMGIARGTAYKYLVAMDSKKMLHYEDGEITTSAMSKILIGREEAAAVGKITCGEPALEEENLLYRTSLPTAVFGKGPFYILYAKGDSMEDADVEDGDILVIKKNAEANIGDIIVALDENNENTLKKYGGIDSKSRMAILKYQNEAVYGDKTIMVKELVCQGVLSHVIKKK